MECSSDKSIQYPEAFIVPDFHVLNHDQGQRGTCVAFSVIALLEYYLGYQKRLSQQFLYACCKCDDNDSGTQISTAFECVSQNGVCNYDEWPYNKKTEENEAQIEPERLSEIPVTRFDNIKFRKLYSPKNVDEYKAILSGATNFCPMPIVIGYAFFPQLNNNTEWIQMPALGQVPDGGHAVLIYAWKNTPGYISKGYFLAQNSWGLGSSASNTPGTIKIPFEYVEEFALDAGTISCTKKYPCFLKSEYAQTIIKRKCLPSIKLQQRSTPKPNSEKGMNSCHELIPENKMEAVKENFFRTQRANISEAGYSLPGIGLSFWQQNGFGAEVDGRIFNVNHPCFEKNVDIGKSADFKVYMKNHAPANDLDAEIIIYRIPIQKKSLEHYRVISAFLDHPNQTPVSPSDIKLLLDFVENVVTKGYIKRPPIHRFVIIGTSGTFCKECSAAAADPTIILCEQLRENIWSFHLPQNKRGICTDDFLSHVIPGEYYKEVEDIVTHWSDNEGQITVKNIKNKLHIKNDALLDSSIERALDKLFYDGEYGVKTYRAESGDLIRYVVKLHERISGSKKTWRFSIPLVSLKRKCRCACIISIFFLLISPLVKWILPIGGSGYIITVLIGILGTLSTRTYLNSKLKFERN